MGHNDDRSIDIEAYSAYKMSVRFESTGTIFRDRVENDDNPEFVRESILLEYGRTAVNSFGLQDVDLSVSPRENGWVLLYICDNKR